VQTLKPAAIKPSFAQLKKNKTTQVCALKCPEPSLCPLNSLGEGKTARVRRLVSTPELNLRLREMGVFEDQRVKLLARPSNLICQVCNVRLAISNQLAEHILVEPISPQKEKNRV
jgi:Fe2+ transport system protein FeoA